MFRLTPKKIILNNTYCKNYWNWLVTSNSLNSVICVYYTRNVYKCTESSRDVTSTFPNAITINYLS